MTQKLVVHPERSRTSSVALALSNKSSTDNTIRPFFNRDRVGRCCVSTIFTSLSPSTCSELGLGLSKLFGWSVVLGQICQHSDIFQKYWGNQCDQAVSPTHRFIHHCQYWLNLHCHSHILQSSLELLHHGFPRHVDASLKMFHFLTSSAGTSQSIFHNKKCTR